MRLNPYGIDKKDMDWMSTPYDLYGVACYTTRLEKSKISRNTVGEQMNRGDDDVDIMERIDEVE